MPNEIIWSLALGKISRRCGGGRRSTHRTYGFGCGKHSNRRNTLIQFAMVLKNVVCIIPRISSNFQVCLQHSRHVLQFISNNAIWYAQHSIVDLCQISKILSLVQWLLASLPTITFLQPSSVRAQTLTTVSFAPLPRSFAVSLQDIINSSKSPAEDAVDTLVLLFLNVFGWNTCRASGLFGQNDV